MTTGTSKTTKPAARTAPADSVKMVRDPESYPAPHVARVHPDEVENYRSGGWQEDGE